MSDLVGNPEDWFSHNKAHSIDAESSKGADQTPQMQIRQICVLVVSIFIMFNFG